MAVEMFRIIQDTPPTVIPEGLDSDALVKLYRLMVLTRVYDEKGTNMAKQGKTTIYYPAIGEEAAVVGSVMASEPQDWIFPYYRQAGAYIIRGTPLEAMFGQLLGNSADICLGHQNPGHYSYRKGNAVSNSSPVGTQIIQAMGAALASRIKKSVPPPVMLTYFGDGATSSNDFHAGMTFAGVFRSPVLFLCINNQWAISMPVARQSAVENLADKALGYGFEGRIVDGNDVLAVYEATRQALHRARSGEGPQFLELKTYRIGGHSTADNPARYRSESEAAFWQQQEPLLRYRRFLEMQGLWDSAQEEALWKQTRAEINAALDRAEAQPALPWETLFADVYSYQPELLAQERQAIAQSPEMTEISKEPQ